MRQDVGETFQVSHIERLHRAYAYSDQVAWAAFQQGLEETVLTWFHEHPGSQAACRVQSERRFVAQAFERLRQAVFKRQVTFETLSEVLVYLRVSLNGVILETLRVSKRTGAVSSSRLDEEDRPDGSEVWDRLQALLSNERDRRLAYLLYHCGLKPSEIVGYCPQEWNDTQEVIRLQHAILERFMNDSNW
jgi:hypothetical protein